MSKSIKRLGAINRDTKVILKNKVKMSNGVTVHTATIKRDKPIPKAR